MLPIIYSDKCVPKTPPYLVRIKGGDGWEGSIYFKKPSTPVKKSHYDRSNLRMPSFEFS